VPYQGVKLFLFGRVPNFYRAVYAAGCQQASVGVDGERSYARAVPPQGMDNFASRDIPEASHAVPCARGNPGFFGIIDERQNRASMGIPFRLGRRQERAMRHRWWQATGGPESDQDDEGAKSKKKLRPEWVAAGFSKK
jgi:hypothetical protein